MTATLGYTQLKDVAKQVINPATKEKQDENIVLATTLNQLVGTLNELTARLSVLTGMANAGSSALRVAPITSVSTAVTGTFYQTTQPVSQALNGAYTAKVIADSQNNLLVTQANIINVIGK